MKKLLVGLLLLMGTHLMAIAAVNDDPVKKIDLTEMIEKAKAEGATWTEAQWKEAFREVMGALAPMMKDMLELSKKAKALGDTEDVEAMLKLQQEVEAIQAKYQGVEKQVEEFGNVAESFDIGKQLSNDDAFQQEVFKEFGLTELMGEVEGDE